MPFREYIMGPRCSILNLFAALRGAASAGWRFAGDAAAAGAELALALTFAVTCLHLASNPEDFGAVLHYPKQLAAGLLSFVILLGYGLYRNRVKTICSLVACVLAVGILGGGIFYCHWVNSVTPDFSADNLLALYTVTNVSWSTHLALLPAQFGIGLVALVGTCMCLALVYVGLVETCRYGAKIRQQQASE
jgi:hypothetical protein